ncbi:MAG: polysaccharide deacetylase family protein [Rhizobium sp.]|nr:polysaccharide deacetylase family protein [Rhizobium sp.]
MTVSDWTPLLRALDAWEAKGRVARFWLRDDDAVAPTPALQRLLDLCGGYDVPAVLAVIPARAEEALAREIGRRTGIGVVLHGWSHSNHAPEGQKKQELGAYRPADVVLRELDQGFGRLRDLFGARFTPVLVPPWNRIDAVLLPQLAGIGLRGLSVFGPEKPGPLPVVNTHADIMDWHGTGGCRPVAAIVEDIVGRLDQMMAEEAVMGLLTHHLVHDEAAWRFIEALFRATAGHPGCRWCGVEALFPGP